jgi:hypothetical protein
VLLKRATALTLLVAAACGRPSPTTPPTPGPPPPQACTGVVGVSCFGTSNYLEYIPGDYPLVISVPHGGALTPPAIPNRTAGTSVTDTNTIELGQAVSQAFQTRSGRRPHLVLMHLRRTKLDANRDIGEAAQGNVDAMRAWTEYHDFIEQAMAAVRQRSGTGLYIDLHGHGHPKGRLELGYLLSAATLNGSDTQLNGSNAAVHSSLRLIALASPLSSSALIRGPSSLGGLLQARVPAVPSPSDPSPGDDPYFDGGYSTSRHTVSLPGLQIESHFSGVRDSALSRAAFGDALAEAVVEFLRIIT